MTNDIIIWLVLLGVTGAAILVLAFLRFLFGFRRDDTVKRRLGEEKDEEGGIAIAGAFDNKEPTGLQQVDSGFERMILRTGLDTTPNQALALMAFLGILLATLLYIWKFQLGLATLGFAVGIGVPLLVFWYLQSRYQWRLQQQLPDAFYLLARSLRAGMALEQAIESIGEQGVQPLAGEFKRCAAQMRLGLTVPAALNNMARRVQLTDFNAFVSAVTYFQQTGGNLALVLDRLAASTRDRNQFRGHFLAVTAQARISGAFLGLAPFLMLLGYALFDPDHVQLFFSTTKGWIMLAIAMVLNVVGLIWLYLLMRVEY